MVATWLLHGSCSTYEPNALGGFLKGICVNSGEELMDSSIGESVRGFDK